MTNGWNVDQESKLMDFIDSIDPKHPELLIKTLREELEMMLVDVPGSKELYDECEGLVSMIEYKIKIFGWISPEDKKITKNLWKEIRQCREIV
jgi:hypothetical protein